MVRRHWWIVVAAIAMLGLVVPPYVLLWTQVEDSGSRERDELLGSFHRTYGYEMRVVEIVSPGELWLIYWERGDMVHASLRLDDLWVEVGSVPKEQSVGE